MATYQAGAVLEALGDPTRRTIFEMLGEQPQAVGELARRLPVSRPAVSQHLKVLKQAGIVIDRPRGTQRIYEIDRDGLAILRSLSRPDLDQRARRVQDTRPKRPRRRKHDFADRPQRDHGSQEHHGQRADRPRVRGVHHALRYLVAALAPHRRRRHGRGHHRTAGRRSLVRARRRRQRMRVGRGAGIRPPTHVALSWRIDGKFKADPDHASRVDVWFTEESAD